MDKQKFRIVKSAADPGEIKSGSIQVTDDSGRSFFKLTCDHCRKIVTVSSPPPAAEEFLCVLCRRVRDQGKATTKVSLVKDTVVYRTPCDRCARVETTRFIPLKGREFLCLSCMRQKRARQPGVHPDGGAHSAAGLRIRVQCHECGKKVTLGFKPPPEELFFCTQCRSKKRGQGRKLGSGREQTRVMFKIECVVCGKKETVNFVPGHPAEAICVACFRDRKRSQDRRGQDR